MMKPRPMKTWISPRSISSETALHDVRLQLDRVVDDYAPVIAALEQDIREVEEDVFSQDTATPAERIYELKREVRKLYGAMAPLVEPIDRLERGDHAFIPGELGPYFRDVSDHLIRFVREVDGFRELVTSILTANLTQISVRQNEDVRKISAWAAIIAVPTAIAGIYGMNFEHMPELGWTFGYPLVLAVIAAVCFALYRNFKRVGWL
jgi:magnesium transporter